MTTTDPRVARPTLGVDAGVTGYDGPTAGAATIEELPEGPLTTPRPDSLYTRFESVIVGAATVAGFLLVWHLVASARIMPPLFLPGPADVAEAYGEIWKGGELAQDLSISGQEMAVGYGLAAVTGVLLGLAIGWYRRLSYALDPFISFFYATPRIVLLPLLIIWFGIGVQSKIAVVFLGAFFAIVINTAAGVRNLDAHLVKVARSFGARDLWLFRTITIPGSVPFILTGLRLGTGHALVGVVVGELVASQHGIGHQMAIAGATFQSAKLFGYLMFIAMTGVILTVVLQRLERKFEAWRPRA